MDKYEHKSYRPVSNITFISKMTEYYIYANDADLYTAFELNDKNSLDEAALMISDCVKELWSWMSLNKLKLNDKKKNRTDSNNTITPANCSNLKFGLSNSINHTTFISRLSFVVLVIQKC